MSKIIDLSLVIGEDIRTRSRIRQLTDHLLPDLSYDLDFSHVNFISRSFADELVSLVDSSAGRITCVNLPEHIEQLLAIVRRNRNTPPSSSPTPEVIKLETEKQMEEFFSAF